MNRTLRWLCTVPAAAWLTACGGGGGNTPAPTVQAQATSSQGTMSKTSATTIAVNGVTYNVAGATVLVNDRSGSTADLKNGMVVRVRGSSSGSSGTATEVEVHNEVRGAVTAVSASTSPKYFMIGEVKVSVDDSTVYDDLVPPSFDAIKEGLYVEVYGQRDATGEIIATRVEGKGNRNAAEAEVDEIRGAITAIGSGESRTFNIGSVTVSHTAATTFRPDSRCSASVLAVGLVVEVHGAFTAPNAFAATRIDCEDMEDDDHSSSDTRIEIEGFVTELNKTAGTFKINGQLVAYGPATEFHDGSIDDLLDNAKVEVEGRMNGGTLMAHEIEFKRVRVILSTVPSSVTAGSLTLFGKQVTVNDLTEIRARNMSGDRSSTLSDVVAGTDRVEVRAFLDHSGRLVAERITEIDRDDRDVIQAYVVAENEATYTLGLLDPASPIMITFAPGARYEGDDDQMLTQAQFFAAVVPASGAGHGTLVKVKGRVTEGGFTADEAELED